MMNKDIALREAAVATVETANETSALLSMIERVAMNPQADLDKMERLLEMRERMEARAAKQAYLDAFARMQEELPAVEKKGKGHNIKYARFEDLIGTIKPYLAKHGFSLSFRTSQSEKTLTVTCVLGHAAGHTEETSIDLPADASGSKNAVQSWGSSTSYGKRYAAMTLLGIATRDEDDDGARSDTSPKGPPTDDEIEDLKALIAHKKSQTTIPKVCQGYNIEKLGDLTRTQFEQVKTITKQRIAR
jgi:hypothetical protein